MVEVTGRQAGELLARPVEMSCLPSSPWTAELGESRELHFSSRLEQTPMPNMFGSGPLRMALEQLANEV